MSQFNQALADKAPLLGTFIKTPHPHNTEVLSQLGFNTLCLDAEHAPFGRADLDSCILAARANQQHVIVRIPNDHHDTILNALDLGADGIVVPHVKTPQQLEKVIANSYYGHNGRGYAGSTRMASYTTSAIDKNLAHNKANTTIIAQIEDLDALDCLDEICEVEGLHCLFIGRMDLTVALGETNPNAPIVIETVEKIVATANKYGVTTGMFIANLDELEQWLEQKVSLFLLGSDHSFMLAGARNLQARFEQAKNG
ncbi:aldolase/citrate lyase family protein [Psychrobium sp. MM17-31]|uniref:HpcH/HpaI aldolase family protein n=1 Tax=Psychrobium sp. MM17-31 TaxID=2917758 RepID=UPI001EF73213|nr:aldolase/citrate lyase family protein [Psychrobium sp. MM17-31]MCG7533192.1 aldolase/citrate lyase family protein [Psychrobium sp. MM17-31]